MKTPKFPTQRGFTLVELLTVVLIISVLLTIAASGLRNAGGRGTVTALASTEALFDEARSLALGKSTRARVLIDFNDPGSETYLRRALVAFEELDADGVPKPESWKLVGRGYPFPDKVYFSRVYSKTNHDAKSGDLPEMTLAGNGSTYSGNFLYYEFNSEGLCTTGLDTDGNYQSPSFVVGEGVRPSGGEPRATGDARRDFTGFLIWRNGSTAVFRDPGQILGDEKPTEF